MSDSAIASRHWKSASHWGARELHILNVDNEESSGRSLLDPVWDDYEDENLSRILRGIPCDVSEYEEMLRLDGNGIDSMHDFEERFDTRLGVFYESMSRVVRSKNARREVESCLNIASEDLRAFVAERGSVMPLRNDSGSSTDSTGGKAGSPPNSRAIRFDLSPQDPCVSGQRSQDPEQKMPKSSSMKSVLSNASDEMGTSEDQTEHALYALLGAITRSMNKITLYTNHSRLRIRFGDFDGPIAINDGQISLSPRIRNTNDIPLVNLECKSRKGTCKLDALSKIQAQEFGECLAIVQTRNVRSKNIEHKTPDRRTIYSIGAHGRRAYLLRVEFSPEYLDNLDRNDLAEARVVVTRSRPTYRLDKADELKEFVKLIYKLCMSLEQQVAAGRRF
ncbi:protein of unknown function [Taphrina deformans PYCC 5710]|uniref:Uncharacterized protein n=1 Tax=Taphrina deformans (strain PYCC 5710 / ATCC 11124 / CBS 356.35 / IMI 108563 / JCM 9778 / NBRC 8474) TaxID=1097556 RepID=R4X9A4_TAPDE|nr:protein of unknown function [Taphrina deformans PYCC 5710]|eukprot:CCG82306.1 protein of unknown function [Taphrina deformans PYCC 5710]